jgi:hypothetical protein
MTVYQSVSDIYGAIKKYSYNRDGFEGMLLNKHLDSLVMLEDVSDYNNTSVHTREVSIPYKKLLEILASSFNEENRDRFLQDFSFEVQVGEFQSQFMCDSDDALYRHRALLAILKDAGLISLHNRSDDIDPDSSVAFAMYKDEPFVYINSSLAGAYMKCYHLALGTLKRIYLTATSLHREASSHSRWLLLIGVNTVYVCLKFSPIFNSVF